MSDDELQGVAAAYRLGGVEAVKPMLNERFRDEGDLADEELTFMPFRFVRVRPASPRASHVVEGVCFRREAGWHRVSRSLARKLAAEPENDLNPAQSPKVFEVQVHRPYGRVAELDR